MYEWTTANLGRQIGVFLDGKLINAPRIDSPLGELIMLDSSFSRQEAEEIVRRVRGGGL